MSLNTSKQSIFLTAGALLGFLFLFLFSVPVASALTWNVDFTTVNSNSSNYWNTADHGSLGSILEISHSWLSNLNWSVAGHIMDTNLDMNSFNVQEIDKAYFDSGAFISSDDNNHLDLHADYIDLHGNLSTIWNVRLNTDGNGSIGPSHGNLVFGSGGDTYLYYNGSDFIIDPDAVGSGDVVILGDIRADNFYGNWNGSSNYVPYTGANQNVDLGANNFTINTSAFFVNSNTGNVGIGTTSPDFKLQVNGDIAPETNATYSIGTSLIQWLNGYFVNLFVSNDLKVGGNLNVTGNYIKNGDTGFSGSCVNMTYSGGIAISCND